MAGYWMNLQAKRSVLSNYGTMAPCVLTASFGNQAFDHALLQLADFVRKRGFRLVDGAAAFKKTKTIYFKT